MGGELDGNGSREGSGGLPLPVRADGLTRPKEGDTGEEGEEGVGEEGEDAFGKGVLCRPQVGPVDSCAAEKGASSAVPSI